MTKFGMDQSPACSSPLSQKCNTAPPAGYGTSSSFAPRCALGWYALVRSALRLVQQAVEPFSRARVGLATHRTASLENNRCCPCLL